LRSAKASISVGSGLVGQIAPPWPAF